MLEVENVSRIYKMGDSVVYALKDASLSIARGDFVAIMGPSGSGKSTLMNILGLLDAPDSGAYRIAGRDVAGLGEEQLALLRRRTIGFVFQQFNLLPRMTALENVALPLFYHSPGVGTANARALLEVVGLGSRVQHKTNELSGGQQQRVAIARALVNSPTVIFADEPTGNLDSASEKEIMAILRRLNEGGITIVMITHEEDIGAQAKRRIRMRDGKVIADERLEPLAAAAAARPAAPPQPPRERGFVFQALGHVRQSLHSLWSNKVRTALSMLGILIGVAAVITMLAIGNGAQREIERQLSSLGSNLLILRPGATRVSGVAQESRATRLSLADAQELKGRLTDVRDAVPIVSGRAQATHGGKNWNTEVTGAAPEYARMRSATPARGRFFSQLENQTRSMVAVIGATVARELFADKDPLGESFKVNKLNFQVIGVLPSKGSSGWRDQDDVIVIPVQTAMRRLFGKTYVDSIEIEVADPEKLEDARERVLAFMEKRHRIPPSRGEDAFRVQNLADIRQAISASGRTMSALLAAIAAISLIVGGIGIMNIMLVSVTERTREIGLRKAIGARPADILIQFLIEAVVLTMTGGVCGVLFGWAATSAVARALGWATFISASSVALAFLFSVAIGLIFGIYPARRAARSNPIEALRHE